MSRNQAAGCHFIVDCQECDYGVQDETCKNSAGARRGDFGCLLCIHTSVNKRPWTVIHGVDTPGGKSWVCRWTPECRAFYSKASHLFVFQAGSWQGVGGTRLASLASGQADRLSVSRTACGPVRLFPPKTKPSNSYALPRTLTEVSLHAVTAVTLEPGQPWAFPQDRCITLTHTRV